MCSVRGGADRGRSTPNPNTKSTRHTTHDGTSDETMRASRVVGLADPATAKQYVAGPDTGEGVGGCGEWVVI